jgi:hypothetical protein
MTDLNMPLLNGGPDWYDCRHRHRRRRRRYPG